MGIKIRKISVYITIFAFLLVCSLTIAISPKITEPHTRFNPWMNECVYFFTFGQCYVDLEHCSMEYGKEMMANTMLTLDMEKECIYSREEYHKYLEAKKDNASKRKEVQEEKGPFKFVIQETDYISLLPKAYDPDEDSIIYHFTSPLNVRGEWQTAYGDAGVYNVTVTASDGKLSASKNAVIVVKKKEEPPVIESFSPVEKNMDVNEGSKVNFGVVVSDKNKDELVYSWKLDGKEVSKEKDYVYDVDYGQAGNHVVLVGVSDKAATVKMEWDVIVVDVNRKPDLERIDDINVKETDTIVIEPKAADLDNDRLTFSIDSDKFKQVDGRFEWKTTYDNSGEYAVKVGVSDGKDTASQDVRITVENVNRAPIILNIRNEK